MMIDLKNMFNGFYPRDISAKVRSTFRAGGAPDNLLVRLPRMATASPHPIITNC